MESTETKHLKTLEDVIAKAIKKVGARKENDLCRYLPMTSGGYMHHFTLRKMKHRQPQELGNIIERHILQSDKPQSVAPKRRAPRGSRKRRELMNLSKSHLDRLLSIARLAGDKEIVAMLSPNKSVAACKRELISSVRKGKVDQELWNAYADSIAAAEVAHAQK